MILQVDSTKLNQALTMLGNLSGNVSFLKVQPIIQAIQESIIEEELSDNSKNVVNKARIEAQEALNKITECR